MKAVVPLALALGVGACASNVLPTNFDYVQAPSFDKIFVPNPTEFAPKQPALTPAGPGDLVDANGYCAGGSPPPAPAPQAAPGENASDPAAANAAPAAAAAAGQGIALQMTECQVVAAAGPPASVQISGDERGNRIVTMTYNTPERPIYRFEAGRLDSIERGAVPPPEPKKKPARKPVAKKKYVPPKTQS